METSLRLSCTLIPHWMRGISLALIITAVLLGLLVISYVVLVKIEARLEVKSQPREPMFECGTHGFIRKKHLITHLDQEICPWCFDERIRVRLDSTVRANR